MPDANGDKLNGLWKFLLLKEKILNAVNKNPESRSYGCCDRHYWGWKVRDFPDMTLQYSILPFGILLDRNSQLEVDLFKAMISFWTRNVNNDGSADQVFPGEKSAGPTLYGLSALLSSRALISDLFTEREQREIEKSLRISLRFALANPETYGHIANHKALYAYSFLLAHQWWGDPEFESAYRREIGALLEKFTDGWFLEYETADPGYQTQCLHYLTLCYQTDANEGIKRKITEGAEAFCAYFVFPDRSYSGLFSGRATELFYPYSFFYWAEEIKTCSQIVNFLYGQDSNALVRWYALDYENAIRLGANYLLSFPLYKNFPFQKVTSGLPCLDRVIKRWDTAGLAMISDQRKHMVINLKRGGIFKLVNKKSKKQVQDTGYVIEYRGRKYTNAIYSDKALYEILPDGRYSVDTLFYLIRDNYFDSVKLMFLRILGLTIFQFTVVTNLVKKAMLKTLLLKKEAGPFTFKRTVRDWKGGIRIEDIIEPLARDKSYEFSLTDRMVPFHMACAGYFSGTGIPDTGRYVIEKKQITGVNKIVTTIDLNSDPVGIEREFLCSPF